MLGGGDEPGVSYGRRVRVAIMIIIIIVIMRGGVVLVSGVR